MKFKKNWKNQKWFAYTVAACSAVVLYMVLSNLDFFWGAFSSLLDVLSPVIMGVVFAYIINPIVNIFKEKVFFRIKNEKLIHPLSVICAMALVILFFAILIVALVPQVIESIMVFISNAGSYPKEIGKLFGDIGTLAKEHGLDINGLVDMGNSYFNDIIASLPERMNSFLAASYSFGVGLFNIGLAFMLAIYFLMAKDSLLEGLKKLFKAFLTPKRYAAMADFWGECHKILIRYITFDIVDGIIVGVCNFIYMTICGMPYSVLISVVVGITNLAPTFGPIAGGIIGAFILVLTEPLSAIAFVIFTIVLQLIDGYVIKPRLFGSSLGVPAVWILVTIIVGGNIFGVLGILLAIPFAAIFTYAYRNIIEERLEEQTLKQIKKGEEKEKKKQAADHTNKNYWD